MESARSISAVAIPTGGAPATRSMYASRKITKSLIVSRKVETPSQSRVAGMTEGPPPLRANLRGRFLQNIKLKPCLGGTPTGQHDIITRELDSDPAPREAFAHFTNGQRIMHVRPTHLPTGSS